MLLINKYPDINTRWKRLEAELEKTVSTAQRKIAIKRLREILKGNGDALPLADLATVCYVQRMTLWRYLHDDQLPSGINAESILEVCNNIDIVRTFWEQIILNWVNLKKGEESIKVFWPSDFTKVLNGELPFSQRLDKLVRLHISAWARSKE